MKKKICISLIWIISIILVISTTYADVIIPRQDLNSYSSSEKIESFSEYMESPLKEIITILIILFVVFGLILLTIKIIKNKEQNNIEEKSNFILILRRAFFIVNVALSLASIYLTKIVRLFDIKYNSVTYVDIREENAQKLMIWLYIIYAVIMFGVGIKKKNKKIICTLATCLTITILIICLILFNDINIYHSNYYDLLKSF